MSISSRHKLHYKLAWMAKELQDRGEHIPLVFTVAWLDHLKGGVDWYDKEDHIIISIPNLQIETV